MAAEWWNVPKWSINDLFPGAPDLARNPFQDDGGLDTYKDQSIQGLLNSLQLPKAMHDQFYNQLVHADSRQTVDGILQDAQAAADRQATIGTVQAGQNLQQQQYDDWINRQNELEAKAAENERLGLSDIDAIRSEYLPKYDRDISRYEGFLKDPNTIYSDAELASQLTSVEQSLAGQLKEAGMAQAKQLSDSGLRASGKLQNRMGMLEQQAGYLKGQNKADLLGRIKSYLGDETSGLRGARGSFDRGLTSAEGQVRSGGFADLSGLQGLGLQGLGQRGQYGLSAAGLQSSLPQLSYSSGGNIRNDIVGLGLANANQNVSTGLNFTGGLIGNAMQMPSQILPFFKAFS